MHKHRHHTFVDHLDDVLGATWHVYDTGENKYDHQKILTALNAVLERKEYYEPRLAYFSRLSRQKKP